MLSSERDLQCARFIKQMVDVGTFSVQGNAVFQMADALLWLRDLIPKIEAAVAYDKELDIAYDKEFKEAANDPRPASVPPID